MVRAEFAGEQAPELVVRKTILEFSPSLYAVRFDGQANDEGTYAVSTAGERNIVTLTGITGVNSGRTIPGIFQLVGARLRVCFGFDGELPGSFETDVGSKRYLAVYRRVVR